MIGFLDRCSFTSGVNTDADFTVGSPIVGYLTPVHAGAVDGTQYYYSAENELKTQWEVGTGTWNSATNTLQRTSVLVSSAGGSKVSFLTMPVVFITATADAFLNIKGEKGDTGPQGPQGEKGDTGDMGPQGPAGADGTGAGTVTSVGLSLPSIFNVTGSPVSSSGTLTGALATQSANMVFAGPSSGSAAAPTFRALVGADLPNPSTSVLGGVRAVTAVSHQWIASISTSGVPALSQPAFSDISGTVAASQLPNPTTSAKGGVQAINAVASKWVNAISTSGVPSLSQPAITDLLQTTAFTTFSNTSVHDVLGSGTVSGSVSGGYFKIGPLIIVFFECLATDTAGGAGGAIPAFTLPVNGGSTFQALFPNQISSGSGIISLGAWSADDFSVGTVTYFAGPPDGVSMGFAFPDTSQHFITGYLVYATV